MTSPFSAPRASAMRPSSSSLEQVPPTSGAKQPDGQTMPAVGRIALLVTLAACILAGTSQAASPTAAGLRTCLEASTHSGLHYNAIVSGLTLTPDQKREIRFRLASYWSVRGFPGIEGIGLATVDKATIKQRIAAEVAKQNAHPVGWPCPEFVNELGVIKWVRAKLIYNGFRPNMTFYTATSPRQIGIRAIQDGQLFIGVIVKSGDTQITMRLDNVPAVGEPRQGSQGGSYNVGFES